MVLYIFLVVICPLPYVPPWIQHPHPIQSTHSLLGYSFTVSAYHNLYLTPHPPLPKDSDITIATPICSLSPHRHYTTLPQSLEVSSINSLWCSLLVSLLGATHSAPCHKHWIYQNMFPQWTSKSYYYFIDEDHNTLP